MSDGEGHRPRVAIDGPAGAGKSTVARQLAERLGYTHVDTGAIYRTVALAAKRASIAWQDAEGLGQLCEKLAGEKAIRLERAPSADLSGALGTRVLLFGEDVSQAIRTPEMSQGASRVSALHAVRAALLAFQREAGAEGGVVLEGRDIGTVVFPDAEAKFFLTASPDERAARRFAEDHKKGIETSLEETLADVVARDRADYERAVAPLRKAADAIEIDSTGRGVDSILDEMESHVRRIERAMNSGAKGAA